MKRVRRQRPRKQFLLVDTNILFHDDKSIVVAPEFELFWEKHADDFDIELLVPEVVFGELLFQHTRVALNLREKADQNLQKVAAIADKAYAHRVSETRVRTDVKKRLERWAQKVGATIEPTPIDVVDWAKLIDRAVWRRPPFSENKKNPLVEKGFRDALIMETVNAFYAESAQNVDVAFCTGDRLLSDAVLEALGEEDRFSHYQTLEDYASYLRLTKEALDQKFIRGVQARATKKFYTPKDPTSLLHESNILDRIQEGCRAELLPGVWRDGAPLSIERNRPEHWIPIGSQTFLISGARFVRLDGEHDFVWVNIITVEQPFRHEPQVGGGPEPSGASGSSGREIRVLKLDVEVTWSARVSTDGRFIKRDVVSVEAGERRFDKATTQDARAHGFELPADFSDLISNLVFRDKLWNQGGASGDE